MVSSGGNVGIGTTSPVAQLEITRSFLRPENMTSAYTMETVSFNTSASVVSRDITGVEFVATSSALTTFGDLNGSSVSGVGMSIDGSGLGLSSNGILTG